METKLTLAQSQLQEAIKEKGIGFLDLPGEVRNAIYRLVLKPRRRRLHNKIRLKNCGQPDAVVCWPDRDLPKPPGICRTCRQIRHETLSIWYGEHKFCLMSWPRRGTDMSGMHYPTCFWWNLWDLPDDDGWQYLNIAEFFQKWLSQFPEGSLNYLKRLDLELYTNIISPCDSLRRVWEICFSNFPQGTADLETGFTVSVKRDIGGHLRNERLGIKRATPGRQIIDRLDRIVDVLQLEPVDYWRPCFKNVNIFLLFAAFESENGQHFSEYRDDVHEYMNKYVHQKFQRSL